MAGQLLVAVPAAYSLEISSFRFKEPLLFLYIVIMLLPLQVTLVPNYIMAEFLHINGSYLAVILPAVFNPFGVFLMRQYKKGLRREYIEAAKIDGAGHIRIFCNVQLPLAKSAVAALAILMFIEYWNVVDQAVVFIREPMAMPLSVFLSNMVNDSGASVIFAGSCFYILPVIRVFLYGQ